MADKQVNATKYYMRNQDWSGRVLLDDEEIQIVPSDQPLRVFLNRETIGFLPHRHDAMELIMPVEGEYVVTVLGNTYHLQPGDILVIPSQTTHSIDAPESGQRFIYMVDPSIFSMLRGYSSVNSLMARSICVTPESHASIYHEFVQLMARIREEYLAEREFCDYAIYGDLFRAFMLLARYELGRTDLFADSKEEKRREYITKLQQTLDYIDIHFTEHLTLDFIAQYSGFSKFYFTRLFKEYTGRTVYEYLQDKRVYAAEKLLSMTDLPVTDIAFQTGFTSVSTFNRIMKERNGCSPSELRMRRTNAPRQT
jgi:AraC-like DNA-binding protein